METDVVVIGAGPVGLFAIFQAGMLGMKAHVIDSLNNIGGQCTALYPEKPIYDIPGYKKIKANDLIEELKAQAAPFNPIYHLGEQVTQIIECESKNFEVVTAKNTKIITKVVVIAGGPGAFGPNRPPLKDIEKFEGVSVLYSINNINNFLEKNVIIAGGGDSALDWTIALAEVAKKVYLVHRRSKFRGVASSINKVMRLAQTQKVEIITGYQLQELIGNNQQLQAIKLSDLDGNVKIIETDYLCPFFGLSQDLGPINHWGLEIKLHHIIANPPTYQTNIKGIYAIGDIASYDGKLKLILTGFAEAASAMHNAYRRVFDGKALHFQYSTTKGLPTI